MQAEEKKAHEIHSSNHRAHDQISWPLRRLLLKNPIPKFVFPYVSFLVNNNHSIQWYIFIFKDSGTSLRLLNLCEDPIPFAKEGYFHPEQEYDKGRL